MLKMLLENKFSIVREIWTTLSIEKIIAPISCIYCLVYMVKIWGKLVYENMKILRHLMLEVLLDLLSPIEKIFSIGFLKLFIVAICCLMVRSCQKYVNFRRSLTVIFQSGPKFCFTISFWTIIIQFLRK